MKKYVLIMSVLGLFSVQLYADAIAVIQPTAGHRASGLIRFSQEGDKVRVRATLQGLTPGKHGFHIHEYGDITSADGTSAGGHYNPDHHKHGLPPVHERHAGSFGNIVADVSGNATLEMLDDTISVSGSFHPIMGRSVVLHVKEDDGSGPAGNAGARIGVGVIGLCK
ncbi:MAG: superoxide dismutase family protein [Candidatus Margulisbacteria bacterium]|nr:superoxide dismutase family protein [Candidatus Margulisiibacteriota bacterium]